jgi:hypothetical protein
MCQEGKFGPQIHDIKDVGVVIEGVQSMRMQGEEVTEMVVCRYEVFRVVGE